MYSINISRFSDVPYVLKQVYLIMSFYLMQKQKKNTQKTEKSYTVKSKRIVEKMYNKFLTKNYSSILMWPVKYLYRSVFTFVKKMHTALYI